MPAHRTRATLGLALFCGSQVMSPAAALARDASGTILFKIGFGDLLSAEGERAEAQAGVAVSFREDSTYDYGQAA